MQGLLEADEATDKKKNKNRPRSQALQSDVPEDTILSLRDAFGNSALHLMYKHSDIRAVKYVLKIAVEKYQIPL